MKLLEELRTRTKRQSFERYQHDPVGFVADELHCTLTGPQKQVCEAVRDYPVTVVQSANAVGKTHAASGVALWFLRVFPQSKVVATAAPPLENLERLLWGEVETRLTRTDAFADADSGYLRVEMGPEWWMVGRAIPASGTSAQREAKFSGLHAPHLLFIIDEGDAVPDEVYRGIESCMSGGHVRLLILFNPRASAGPVYRMIQTGQAHLITLDAFGHPNVITGRDVVPGAVTRETTVSRISEWSRPRITDETVEAKSAEWFQVPGFLDGATATRKDGSRTPALIGGQWRKITNAALSYMTLARFPGQAENQLINRAWVQAAQQRWLVWRQTLGDTPPKGVRPLHGQDVAEFGIDRNVACLRYGGWVAPFITWNGVDVLETGDRAASLAQSVDAQCSFVDATGIGAGVSPAMVRWWATHAGYKGQAIPVHVGGSPTEEVEEGAFGMLRDQLWWRCREWLRTDPGAMLPPDGGLADELCAPTYQVRDSKIKVMKKEDLRKLLQRSPDLADALCLTFAPESSVPAPASARNDVVDLDYYKRERQTIWQRKGRR